MSDIKTQNSKKIEYNRQVKIFMRKKVRAGSILTLIVLSFFIANPLLSTVLSEEGTSTEVSDWLFVPEVNQTSYVFRGQGVAHIFVEIAGTDYASFTLDGVPYTVSYGLNEFSKTFSTATVEHVLDISASQLPFFTSLCVEPVFLYEGSIETQLDVTTTLTFGGGGPISILTRPDFAYNWLYLQLDEVVIKNIYDTAIYPEVDSGLFAGFVEGGTYIRDDINVIPGFHTLRVKGNGTLGIKVVPNFDADRDKLSNPEEVLAEGIHPFNPIVPDTWGFFEQAKDLAAIPIGETSETTMNGKFSFFIPSVQCTSCGGVPLSNLFYIDVYNGEFSQFVIDGDSFRLEGVSLAADCPITNPATRFVAELKPGWHTIDYSYQVNPASAFSNLSFRVNTHPIEVVHMLELQDSDGDGIKDMQEFTNGLNLYNSDSDVNGPDGLPDNLDPSPSCSLMLEKGGITQVVLPVNPQKNTLLTWHVRKPTTDYSTGNTPRLWMGSLTVQIALALRLFGNSSISRPTLAENWQKSVQTYGLVPGYNASGAGDSLPGNNPNAEYTLIFPKMATDSFEYDVTFPKFCSATNDSILDLRFDFQWVVLQGASVIHFYDPEESILLQGLVKREMGEINYLLGSPTCMTENQVLWALVQNPSLGTPSDYGLGNRVVGGGGLQTVDYLALAERVLQTRATFPRGPTDTEVLYVAGLQQNYDVLGKIRLQGIAEPTFEDLHDGDFETFFSYYSVTDVYDQFKVGDPEIQGEQKILYLTYWYNGSTGAEQRTSIMGLPVHIFFYDFPSAKVLNMTRAMGRDVPLGEIPSSLSATAHDNVRWMYQIFLESKMVTGDIIPVLNYNGTVDQYKELIDNRQDEVDINGNFFEPQSPRSITCPRSQMPWISSRSQ